MGKKVLIVILVIIVLALIGGVIYMNVNQNFTTPNNTNNETESKVQNTNEAVLAQNDTEKNEGVADTTSGNSNILVAYYSYSGNTESFANLISELTGGDLFEIQRQTEYTDLYTEAESEINNNERPALASMPENVNNYDTIFIGYPIWWDRAPAMINTFLSNIDLSGKTVIPFCTSSSDGIEGSMQDINSSAQGANILEGLRISGGNAESSRATIQEWLAGLGFLFKE